MLGEYHGTSVTYQRRSAAQQNFRWRPALCLGRVEEFQKQLRKLYPKYDEYPAAAQLAMLAFAMMAAIRHRANPPPPKKTKRRTTGKTKASPRRH